MSETNPPAYDLLQVQLLVRQGRFKPGWSVLGDLMKEGLDEDDLADCLLALTAADFHGSAEFERNRSFMVDVYTPLYAKRRMYVKFRLTEDRGFLHLDSFKRSTSR